MSAIKLLKIDELADRTQRFKSQLFLNRNVCDFVKDKDGTMKYYTWNGFIPYTEPYEIVSNISEMTRQPL